MKIVLAVSFLVLTSCANPTSTGAGMNEQFNIEIEKHLRLIDVKDSGDDLINLDDYVYLSDGVYVRTDDA